MNLLEIFFLQLFKLKELFKQFIFLKDIYADKNYLYEEHFYSEDKKMLITFKNYEILKLASKSSMNKNLLNFI